MKKQGTDKLDTKIEIKENPEKLVDFFQMINPDIKPDWTIWKLCSRMTVDLEP